MAEIAWELGVSVSPSTILRWVVRYAEEFANRWQFERRVGPLAARRQDIHEGGQTVDVPLPRGRMNVAGRWNPT